MAITMDGIFVNGQKATFRPEDILSGDASAYTEEIGTAVEEWLEANVTGGEQVTDTTLTLPGVPADAKKTGDEIGALKEDFKQISDLVGNIMYSNLAWTPFEASVQYVNDAIIVTYEGPATETNGYASAQCDIDVTNIDAVVLSHGSITGDTGTNPRIRYGIAISSNSTTWINFATNDVTVIDTSEFNTLRLAFYIYFNKPASVGTTATFNTVQLEYGSTATEFIKWSYTAEDKVAREAITGSGNLEYYGEKINFGMLSKLYKCNFEVWKDFVNVDPTYNLHFNQSIAIYGNYVFLFLNGGGVVIVDKTTKEIISTMSLSTVTSNHANSAQFTNVFYDPDDTFPLIAISRCGNSETSSDSPLPGTDRCLLARITVSDNVWNITLVSTIALDVSTFGSSWGIDMSGKKIMVACYRNGTYHTTNNNPVFIYVFDLPTSLSSGQKTLNISDATNIIEIPHYTLQGICSNGDTVFCNAQDTNGHFVYVVSIDRNMVVSKIPLPTAFEPEGVTLTDNALYVSARKGTDSAGVNPLQIYKITD